LNLPPNRSVVFDQTPLPQGVARTWGLNFDDICTKISRGIPQEVDRQLLLRMRHRLTRALTLPEKKMLREIFRAVALGTHAAESPQNNDPLASAPLIEEPV